jgi:hypothetical protein
MSIFLVEELHRPFFKVRGFEGFAGAVRPVKAGSINHVPHLGAVESLALARFGEFESRDDVWIAVNGNFETLSQISSSVHGKCSFSMDSDWKCIIWQVIVPSVFETGNYTPPSPIC